MEKLKSSFLVGIENGATTLEYSWQSFKVLNMDLSYCLGILLLEK